jgi:hypothetical protein
VKVVDEGHQLIEACKQHLLRTMRTLPDCQPEGRGGGSKEIEAAAGFDLALQRQDNWLTWSLLQRMGRDDMIEIVSAGRARYRLLNR